MKIKALLFDNFGVLMDPVYDTFRETVPKDVFDQIVAAGRLSDAGKITNDERNLLMRAILQPLGRDAAQEIEAAMGRSKRNQKLFEFIEAHRKQYKMAIVSNASANVLELYKGVDLNKYFDQVIWSYQVKEIKPELAIYRLAAERLGVQPDECVFIDDRQSNVDGAVTAGMKGIQYCDFEQFKADLAKLEQED